MLYYPSTPSNGSSSPSSNPSICSTPSVESSISSVSSTCSSAFLIGHSVRETCSYEANPLCPPYSITSRSDINSDVGPRLHPRRCPEAKTVNPPSFVRQSERKGQFVENLVESATTLVAAIWPLSEPACPAIPGFSQSHSVLPLKTYIQETLKRSKTRFSTLQVALYYLILLKEFVPHCNFTMEQPDTHPHRIALQCGRRMFLTALMLASKYLQDRNYSAKAWSKITGLQVKEINLNEIAFLLAIDWKLHVQDATFERWQSVLIKYSTVNMKNYWGPAVLSLRPDLSFAIASFGQHMLPTPPPSPPSFSYVPPAYMEPTVIMPPPETMLPLRTVERRPIAVPDVSDVCLSPAASSASRGAMCAAMSIAAFTTSQRLCMDAGAAHDAPARSALSLETSFRFSPNKLSSSPSDTSPTSPGSMISDHSSQSSRSSSFSISSSPPLQTSLLQRATKNAQSRKFHDRYNEVTVLGSTWDDGSAVCSVTASPEVYLQDYEDNSSASITPRSSLTPRKRPVRGSFDADLALEHARGECDYSVLQQEVRSLLRTLPEDEQIAARALPAQYLSSKRVCLDVNGGDFLDGFVAGSRPRTGPGMWQGIL